MTLVASIKLGLVLAREACSSSRNQVTLTLVVSIKLGLVLARDAGSLSVSIGFPP